MKAEVLEIYAAETSMQYDSSLIAGKGIFVC